MGKKQSKEEKQISFINKMEERFGNAYTVLGEYITTITKVKIRHNLCGYEWDVLPNNLFSGQSKCPQCSGKKRYTTESFSQIVNESRNGEYIVTGEYVNAYTKISIKHLECGYEWGIVPYSFLCHKANCPRCQGRERYTDEDFEKKVKELTFGEITPLDSYKNNYTKIRFQHIVCGAIFEEIPSRIINELKKCPKCQEPLSKGEKRILNHLNDLGIQYETQFSFKDCFYINVLKFDFAIKQNNRVIALIEFDGGQHFKPVEWFGGEKAFKGIQERDQIKNEYCRDNSLPLLRIPYWEEKNIKNIIDDFLFTLFKNN